MSRVESRQALTEMSVEYQRVKGAVAIMDEGLADLEARCQDQEILDRARELVALAHERLATARVLAGVGHV